MSIRAAVYDLLNNYEADVYPVVGPQELTVPYVVYEMRIEPVRSQSDRTTITDVTLTLRIFANDFSDCLGLADTMFAGLDGRAGTYASTETLMICNWVFEGDGGYISELNKYMITQEYILRFT